MSDEYYGAVEGSYRVPIQQAKGAGLSQSLYTVTISLELLADDSFLPDEFVNHAKNSAVMNYPGYTLDPIQTFRNDDGSMTIVITGVRKE